MIGVRYQKNGQAQPFVIFHYSDLDSPTGNVELKEAVKVYLGVSWNKVPFWKSFQKGTNVIEYLAQIVIQNRYHHQ